MRNCCDPRLPRQPAVHHFLAPLLRITRLPTTDPTRSIPGSSLSRSPTLSLLWCPDGDRRKTDGRPDPTPFSTDLDHGCRMRSLSTSQKPCVLRRATPPCALSPNRFLLYADRHPPNHHTAALDSCRVRDWLLRPQAHHPHPHLHPFPSPHSISIDPRPPQTRAASF